MFLVAFVCAATLWWVALDRQHAAGARRSTRSRRRPAPARAEVRRDRRREPAASANRAPVQRQRRWTVARRGWRCGAAASQRAPGDARSRTRRSTRLPVRLRAPRAGAPRPVAEPHPIDHRRLPAAACPAPAPAPNLRVHTTQQARVRHRRRHRRVHRERHRRPTARLLPLRIVSSVAHSPVQDTWASARLRRLAPVVTQPFVDDGTHGDALSGDGVLDARRLDPQAEGFANFAGMIRTELDRRSGDQQGYVAFDVVYVPQVPATWSGAPCGEALRGRIAGLRTSPPHVAPAWRYVITGRVDDATGKPVRPGDASTTSSWRRRAAGTAGGLRPPRARPEAGVPAGAARRRGLPAHARRVPRSRVDAAARRRALGGTARRQVQRSSQFTDAACSLATRRRATSPNTARTSRRRSSRWTSCSHPAPGLRRQAASTSLTRRPSTGNAAHDARRAPVLGATRPDRLRGPLRAGAGARLGDPRPRRPAAGQERPRPGHAALGAPASAAAARAGAGGAGARGATSISTRYGHNHYYPSRGFIYGTLPAGAR